MPRSKDEICVPSTLAILEQGPLVRDTPNALGTIAVDEVLTLDVQKDKISGNALILIAAAQNQIKETLHMAGPVEAAQVAEKMMGVYNAAQGTHQPMNPFGFSPNFAGAKSAFAIVGYTK